MLDRIARSDAHFKHQQRDEPDLMPKEKLEITSDILKMNEPALWTVCYDLLRCYLKAGGEYFSEDEMKWRDPWLYNQMVGQYLTEEDIQDKVDKSDLRFSSVLLKHMDQLRENAWYEILKQKEEGQTEEEEESEEEEEKGFTCLIIYLLFLN
ncbi:coiled-coil domain-containing protein 97-like [Gigantopelta aegis]|uniref:coiled-coil domain-containing protein 97-like n=1 Tax=Gigantopelta aegis TaxID=1735272 RepID=UPI001B889403|nr:coiled-coil domain-containing protein 97-like [Gigantopelta aegis]